MITLTYHCIADDSDELLPKGMSMSAQDFEQQIQHLLRYHQGADPNDFAQYVQRQKLPENSFLLTFDDGYKGQCTLALDILERYQLKGAFFVPTEILEHRRLATVERQRLLQYCNGPYQAFYQRFCQLVAQHYPELDAAYYLPTTENLEGALSYYAEYDFYSPMERLYRKVRETMLPNEVFERIIDLMFTQAFDEQDIIERFFLNWDDVREIERRGHVVGGHGHGHLLESNIIPAQAVADHHQALDLLSQHLALPVTLYAYPYGIYCPETVEALMQRGIIAAFTCETGRYWTDSPLYAHRYDCKAFPMKAQATPNAISELEIKSLDGSLT